MNFKGIFRFLLINSGIFRLEKCRYLVFRSFNFTFPRNYFVYLDYFVFFWYYQFYFCDIFELRRIFYLISRESLKFLLGKTRNSDYWLKSYRNFHSSNFSISVTFLTWISINFRVIFALIFRVIFRVFVGEQKWLFVDMKFVGLFDQSCDVFRSVNWSFCLSTEWCDMCTV